MSCTPQCSFKVANSLTDALCNYFLIYHSGDLPTQSPAFTRLFAALLLIGLNATYFTIILDYMSQGLKWGNKHAKPTRYLLPKTNNKWEKHLTKMHLPFCSVI